MSESEAKQLFSQCKISHDYNGYVDLLKSDLFQYLDFHNPNRYVPLITWCCRHGYTELFDLIMSRENPEHPYDLHINNDQFFETIASCYQLEMAKKFIDMEPTRGPMPFSNDSFIRLFEPRLRISSKKSAEFIEWYLQMVRERHIEFDYTGDNYRCILQLLSMWNIALPVYNRIISEINLEDMVRVIFETFNHGGDIMNYPETYLLIGALNNTSRYDIELCDRLWRAIKTYRHCADTIAINITSRYSFASRTSNQFVRYVLNHIISGLSTKNIRKAIHTNDNLFFTNSSNNTRRLIIQFVKKHYDYSWNHVEGYEHYEKFIQELAATVVGMYRVLPKVMKNSIYDANVLGIVESYLVPSLDNK
jgi:hypothetical protein